MNTKYIITDIDNRMVTAEFDNEGIIGLNCDCNQELMGNIYVGRVENVVKNINCAFIEIAKGVKAFYSLDDNKEHLFLNPKNNNSVNQGDLMLVQVSTDAFKTKPAAVTSKISIPGKYVVLALDVRGVSVSKKIKPSEDITDLKNSLKKIISDNQLSAGFIVRTNAKGVEHNQIILEAQKLAGELKKIIEYAKYSPAFTVCKKGPSAYVNMISGTKSLNIEFVLTDKAEVYEELKGSFSDLDIRFYDDNMISLANLYSLPTTIQKNLNKKVWLKSGAYLVIEQAEALTSIDVNSGKAIDKNKKQDKQKQFFDVNVEAAKEIARQIKIRNISGIIIVDFINIEDKQMNDEMIKVLKEAISHDRITTTFIDITKLGLVELTRKKTGKSLIESWYNKNE